MKVAIWAATDATGRERLRQCLADENFSEVIISPLFRPLPNLVNPAEQIARAMRRGANDGRQRPDVVVRTARSINGEK